MQAVGQSRDSGAPARDRARDLTLLFRGTGKIVGLPDEPGSSVVDRGAAEPRVMLCDTDVLGLGLVDDDFAEGVAVCEAEPAAGAGWRCTPATMRIVDAAGVTVAGGPAGR